MKRSFLDRLMILILLLGVASLILEWGIESTPTITGIINVLDYVIITLFVTEIVFRLAWSRDKREFIRRHWFDIGFLALVVLLFLFTKHTTFFMDLIHLQVLSSRIILIRNVLMVLKIMGRIKKLNYFIKSISTQPAQTITFSFLIVIVLGGILLMLPLATADATRLGALNALFTSTSAVCVTGLIVVDTATRFSLFGKTVIMVLIQIGGLGIMILSYFGAYVIGKRISLEEKIALSYLLNEQDMHKLSRSIVKIITTTFLIEIVCAVLLFLDFRAVLPGFRAAAFFALFHAVSAFCNAGFALFSNNLEAFKSDVSVNLIIAILIILGGISFPVIFNVVSVIKDRLRNLQRYRSVRTQRLSVNSRAVLIATGVLLVSGMFFIYASEHRHQLLTLDLKTQYLSVFFQTVTLRTAGFNTLDIAQLQLGTITLMILFMFIGGASGSTAGGVKVNTVSVILAYIRSILYNREEVTLMKHSIAHEMVSKSFLIVILALGAIFCGTLILALVEPFAFERILFEVVSAFGTVGLSTGITGDLSVIGKMVIIVLMFIGRIGPMTLIVALSQRPAEVRVKYPECNLSIG